MVTLLHEVWVRTDEAGQELPACILSGPPGDGARALLLAEGARLAWTFEAGSHFEAMTIYHRRMHGENYATDEEWSRQPYPDDWLDQQRSDNT